MARGSGDIIGFADTCLHIRRQAGQNSIILSQAKNRGGEELIGKKIMIEKKENGGFYVWENKDVEKKEKNKNKLDIAIEEILSLYEVNKMSEFAWKELTE